MEQLRRSFHEIIGKIRKQRETEVITEESQPTMLEQLYFVLIDPKRSVILKELFLSEGSQSRNDLLASAGQLYERVTRNSIDAATLGDQLPLLKKFKLIEEEDDSVVISLDGIKVSEWLSGKIG